MRKIVDPLRPEESELQERDAHHDDEEEQRHDEVFEAEAHPFDMRELGLYPGGGVVVEESFEF